MGQITERTIGVVGKCSLMITLPKGWLRYHDLKAGDRVFVVTNGDLIIKPQKRRKRSDKAQE